ncbi:ISL3 family transposase [Lysinibacillus halotolerans]
MTENELLQMALNLGSEWKVDHVEFNPDDKELHIFISTIKGSKFECPACGHPAPVYDHGRKRIWRHLNFFQYEAYLHARLPRTDCSKCNGSPKTIKPNWARERSGFSVYFEAFVILLMKAMPVKKVANLVNEHDTTLWPILHHYVEEAREREVYSAVQHVGFDETSRKKGHEYVSIFMDLDKRKVISVTEGKDQHTLKGFKHDLMVHGGHPDNIKEFSIDMSPAFIKGAEEQFPNAALTFDKFHVMKMINEALDETRRKEQQSHPELKNSRYAWIKNEDNLNPKQKETLLKLKDQDLKTAKAYQLKIAFQRFWEKDTSEAEAYLDEWLSWARRSQIPDMVKVAKSIHKHRGGILQWFKSRINNGILEATNGLIQAAKRQARGYRSTKNLITMIYLIAGGLDLRVTELPK